MSKNDLITKLNNFLNEAPFDVDEINKIKGSLGFMHEKEIQELFLLLKERVDILVNTKEFFVDLGNDVKNLINKEEEKTKIFSIAITGLALKIPGADTMARFWQNLQTGQDEIKELPPIRRDDVLRYLSLGQNQENAGIEPRPKIPKSGYLSEIDKFDNAYFKLSPKEASLMDPNQRLFLETVYAAIDDAGQGGVIKNTKTGLYLGLAANYAYRQLIAHSSPNDGPQSLSGNIAGITPGRISYLLNLNGPSLITDTTCSSSLVALHLAAKAIQRGECDQAIAGGIKLNIFPTNKISIGIESKDGLTRSFDDSSDGTNWSEAVAAVFLKPLAKAISDKDNIYAVIKGSAVNQDGTGVGLTAPNAAAQAEVIEAAWQDASVDPKTISYIEAHGTGTKLGDPIEIEGITKAFKKYTTETHFCKIGSVKSNLGHTAEASGLVGLIETCLALKHKEIPPSIHFKEPNRRIDWDNSPVLVNTGLTPWKRKNENVPLRAGVSSFGISGTNCHVVLEEAPPIEPRKEKPAPRLFLLSAKTENALKDSLENYRDFLVEHGDINLVDLCYTATIGRDHHEYRLAIVASNREDLGEKLSRLARAGAG